MLGTDWVCASVWAGGLFVPSKTHAHCREQLIAEPAIGSGLETGE